MDVDLTREAQKMVAAAYKEYLKKRKAGVSKANAKLFSEDELYNKYFKSMLLADYDETVREMCRAFGCKMYINGGFMLSDDAIIYMENRFKNGITDTLSFLAQFIP